MKRQNKNKKTKREEEKRTHVGLQHEIAPTTTTISYKMLAVTRFGTLCCCKWGPLVESPNNRKQPKATTSNIKQYSPDNSRGPASVLRDSYCNHKIQPASMLSVWTEEAAADRTPNNNTKTLRAMCVCVCGTQHSPERHVPSPKKVYRHRIAKPKMYLE